MKVYKKKEGRNKRLKSLICIIFFHCLMIFDNMSLSSFKISGLESISFHLMIL